jgi:hypothetical protein
MYVRCFVSSLDALLNFTAASCRTPEKTWDKRALNADEYYSASYHTISASDAPDSHSGFIQSRESACWAKSYAYELSVAILPKDLGAVP